MNLIECSHVFCRKCNFLIRFFKNLIIHLKFHAFPALEINPKYWQLSHLDFDLILCSIAQGESEIIWDKLTTVTAKLESSFLYQSNNLHTKN